MDAASFSLTIAGSVVREELRGRRPSICANEHGVVVELHQQSGRSRLRYAVGRFVENNSIRWQGVNDLGVGTYARVAINGSNTVFEVHEHPFYRKICYRVGVLNPDTAIIDWDEGGGELGWGRFPAVALSNDDVVVIVYESARPGNHGTYYRVGTIVTDTPDGGRKRVGTWTTERGVFHESVNELSMTMNKKGCVVVAGRRRSHQICLTVGSLVRIENTDSYSINWSASQTHPHSTGCFPAVSINDQGHVALVIQTNLGRQLFYQVGKVDERQSVTLGVRNNYDHGCYPTVVLCNNSDFLEEHETNFSFPRGNRLFYHVGNFRSYERPRQNNEEEEEED